MSYYHILHLVHNGFSFPPCSQRIECRIDIDSGRHGGCGDSLGGLGPCGPKLQVVGIRLESSELENFLEAKFRDQISESLLDAACYMASSTANLCNDWLLFMNSMNSR